jgi:Skp family chaperone for outer membrane proteins
MVQYTEDERKMLERYELERDAKDKQEQEQYTLLNAAKAEGKKENQLETIKTMFENVASIENISYLLDLDLEYVK